MSLVHNLGSAFNTAELFGFLPWKADALQVVQDDGTLVKLANVLSPLDKQSFVKITNTRIANVYNTLAKGAIPIGNQATNTSGQSIFVEFTETASKTVGTQEVLLPIVARIEFRVPNDGDITNADIVSVLQATLAAFHDSAGDPRMTNMMRGVLLPS